MKKLSTAALGFAARSLCAIRGYEAPSGPVLDSARLEIERLAQAAAAYEMGESFDRYVGQRATLTRDVRLGDPGAFLVSGAEVRVVGIVDDETFSVEPADLPGDSVAVSLYDLAFFPEEPVTADPHPDEAAQGERVVGMSPALGAPYGVETASTLDLGDATPETPRHGPQTSAQAMPATAPDVSVGYYRPARPLTVEEVDQLADVCVEYAQVRAEVLRGWKVGDERKAERARSEADELRGRILAMVGRLVPPEPRAEPSGTTEPQGSGCGVDGCEVCGG